ncbi:ADP-forming succinate--CoA ligase subunit beta [Blattabacterium cuenoti]|uniref:ADP-forming succinate--CoA ligase subunit beta n=1 Tax=Blattabacterium cuenoti TaxID=1653831 RepID=UPI00163D1CDE|nr:ADP-forming succinate--CoA ligase subunit beta [Blattabacterium cuenoti]
MNLYEFQGRDILTSFSISVPYGLIVDTTEQAVNAAKIIFKKTNTKSIVIKAQILAGGRGKSGGILIAKSLEDVYNKSNSLLGKYLITSQTSQKGELVKKLLITENIYNNNDILNIHNTTLKEYYIAISFNRDIEKNIILYSKKGGINIETNYKNQILQEVIDPGLGLLEFQYRTIEFHLGITNLKYFVYNLYKAYLLYNAILLEINPLIYNNHKIIALDSKITLDNNALFRINKFFITYKKEEKLEKNNNINFIKLEGNVGCMVNGAGLAMATMDMIKSCGGSPSNFLDIGGDANQKKVEQAFNLILKDTSVKVILINIFGGIVRCDDVVHGIINAYNKYIQKNNKYLKIVFRLQGTNAKIAKQILYNNQLPIFYTSTLKEASNKIQEILSS